MKVPAFFKNRYVLYIAIILGVVNLLGYIAMENYNSMALLVVMFLLARYFSKNIAINICIAIFVTSIVTLNGKITEGNRNMRRSASLSFPKNIDAPIAVSSRGKTAGRLSSTKLNERPREPTEDRKLLLQGVSPTPVKPDPVKPEDPEEPPREEPPREEPPIKEPPREEEPECPKGTELVKGECVPMKMGFRNNVPSSKPAKINNSGDDDMDVAAKMEDAYGNLNKMLGDGAMKSMANETKKLVVQQQELMNTLSTMTPALNKAKETLENLNLPNMEEMTGILKKFT